MEPISLADERIIAEQLGRRPRGLLGVEHRCSYGYPQVILVHPLSGGAPFPTTFWLTCPFLVKKISRLEAAGWVKELERRVERDPPLAASLSMAHWSYIEERRCLLTEKERAALAEAGTADSLLTKGIGGIADLRHIKCLHLHAAHALARENPIGEIVLAMLSRQACPQKTILCSTARSKLYCTHD